VIEAAGLSPFETEDVIAKLEAVEGVQDVKPVLAVEGSDGTKVFGVEVEGPLQLPAHGRLVTASILEGGRGFNADEGERLVMLVGRTFAENHTTPFGYKILGMVQENHKPFFFLGENQVSIQGIYETGDSTTDAGIVLPLGVAQRLAGLEGRASILYVIADEAAADEVEKTLQASMADEARIAVLQ
jgi:ABC-type lipoprotein release transport system permease subunit